jgi:hypothetical protein
LLLCDFSAGVTPVKNLSRRFMEVAHFSPRSPKAAPPKHAHHAHHEEKKKKWEDPHPSHTCPRCAPSPHTTLPLQSLNLFTDNLSKVHATNSIAGSFHNQW